MYSFSYLEPVCCSISSSNCCLLTFSSVQSLSHVWLFETLWIAARQASLSSPTAEVHSNSCPSSRWCHPAIASSVFSFSFCPQSLPASESFPMSQLFAWGGQSTGVSALASFLPKKLHSCRQILGCWGGGRCYRSHPLRKNALNSLTAQGKSRACWKIPAVLHNYQGKQFSGGGGV